MCLIAGKYVWLIVLQRYTLRWTRAKLVTLLLLYTLIIIIVITVYSGNLAVHYYYFCKRRGTHADFRSRLAAVWDFAREWSGVKISGSFFPLPFLFRFAVRGFSVDETYLFIFSIFLGSFCRFNKARKDMGSW